MITTLSEVAPNSSPLGCVEEQYEAKELPVQTDLSTLAIDNSLTTEQSFSDGLYVMLWGNIDALCWLDVLLCYVCHNMSIRNIAANLPYSSVLKKLLLTFDEAQAMIEPLQQGQNKLLCSVMGMERGLVKRGEPCHTTVTICECLFLQSFSKPGLTFISTEPNFLEQFANLRYCYFFRWRLLYRGY